MYQWYLALVCGRVVTHCWGSERQADLHRILFNYAQTTLAGNTCSLSYRADKQLSHTDLFLHPHIIKWANTCFSAVAVAVIALQRLIVSMREMRKGAACSFKWPSTCKTCVCMFPLSTICIYFTLLQSTFLRTRFVFELISCFPSSHWFLFVPVWQSVYKSFETSSIIGIIKHLFVH